MCFEGEGEQGCMDRPSLPGVSVIAWLSFIIEQGVRSYFSVNSFAFTAFILLDEMSVYG